MDGLKTIQTEPRARPKRSRGARTRKTGTTKGRATAAGTLPKPPAGSVPAGRVPAPAPSTPRRRQARSPKAAPPAATPAASNGAQASAAPPALTRSEALQILVDRANGGSKSALDSLRQLMDKCPEIWQHVGNLTRHAEIAWTDLVAGGDHLMVETIKRYVERLKGELAGPAPTPIERLLADQAALTWLASRYAEIVSAKPGTSSLGEAKMRLKRAESAQRRHLASLKTLTELRAYSTRKK